MATREKLNFTLRYLTAPAAAAALASFLTLQADSSPPPPPSAQEFLLSEMSTAAEQGLLHGDWNVGNIALRVLKGNQGAVNKANKAAEQQLLTTAMTGLYAAEGYTDPEMPVPPKIQADAACVVALAGTTTRRALLDGSSNNSASLDYANGLLDQPDSKRQDTDFEAAAAACISVDLNQLVVGGDLTVAVGGYVPVTESRPSSTTS